MVDEDSLSVVALSDVAKYCARSLQGLGRGRDASDPHKCTAPGYMLFEASAQVRRRGRRAAWFVRAYRRRCSVEDATWAIKQRFHLEQFLVRSWRGIRRLICLMAQAFLWLNLWGQDR